MPVEPPLPAEPPAPALPPAPPAPPLLQPLAVQLWPAAHAMPQPPQCAGFVAVSTHVPAHIVCPAVAQVQAPPEQVLPAGQELFQAPQCVVEVATSRQLVPQVVRVAAQVLAHDPSEQTSPMSHPWLHPPQC
jgi:hypothetical protein